MIPCNTSPASEDYADFIVRYSPRAVESLYELAGTTCVNLVSQEFAIVHVPLAGVLPLSLTRQTYSAIPKLYGLQDTGLLPAQSCKYRTRGTHRPDRYRDRLYQPIIPESGWHQPHLKHMGPDQGK